MCSLLDYFSQYQLLIFDNLNKMNNYYFDNLYYLLDFQKLLYFFVYITLLI